MKNIRYKTLSIFLAGGLFLSLLGGCQQEPAPGVEGVETPVKFSVDVPGALSTRALTAAAENSVATIDVLVFEPGGHFVYKTGCSGSEIADDGSSDKKTFTLRMRHGEYDLVILANVRELLAGTTLIGKTKAEVLAALEVAMPTGGKWIAGTSATGYRPIPMWGDTGEVEIDEATETETIDNTVLTRMTARVDVTVASSVTNFKLKSVRVYNYNTLGRLVPATANWSVSSTRATAPSVPASAILAPGPLLYDRAEIDATNNRSLGEIYLFETENKSAAALARTCLVIGGVYSTDVDTTYYRVDFSDAGGDFLDILRNYQYTFRITSVTTRGLASPEEALIGPTKLLAAVLDWKPVGVPVEIPPAYELTVSASTFTFDDTGGDETLEFTASHDWNLTISDALGDPVDWIELIETTGAGSASPFTWTITCDGPYTGEARTAYIFLRTGNLTKTITVTQEAPVTP